MLKIVPCKDCGKEIEKRYYQQVRCFDCNVKLKRNRDKIYLEKNREKINKRQKESYKTGTERVCRVCGKKYRRRFYYTENKYCSRKCYFSEIKIKRRGHGNPSYRHGKNNGLTNTLELRNNIEKIKKASERIFCLRCGSPENINFHHLVYRSEAPYHRNLHNPENLFACCAKCHKWFHSKKSNRDPIVKARNLSVLFPELKYLNL